MKTIYEKIKEAVKAENIENIVYEEGYPMDIIKLDESFTEDEEANTIGVMARAMKVIMDVIDREASPFDDIRVCFSHLPGDEYWGISIGDGR